MTADGFDELLELSSDLRGAPEAAARNVDKALKVTSMHIKKDWAQSAHRSGLAGYAASVDFDMEYGGGEIASDIGPNLDRNQGSFGFVEDAPGGVLSAPQHAGRDALEANEPDFVRGLEIAVFDATAEAITGPLGAGEIGPKGAA
ncbi:hypothetical protein CQ047_17840 [Microbacterium sp. MYb72]|uniref:hypothetical protein n=1 Tax=Microbacterium sp. MYb72 TaxID=1848693 RepID=UPI000CFAA0C7|nr:hypothetical protein [Microbacterium sp. MYb72]PRB02766.1 hypothetical protein CQ047_17840 [Microbacterium sp. MYb72]